MDADRISAVLRARAQVIAAEEYLSKERGALGPSDHYSDMHRDALSAALKEEQKVEDLLATRQEQLDQIKTLSANIDSEKLSHAKELLRKKQELMEKQEELHSFLKSKNMTISDLLAQKEHVNDHGAKMLLLKQLTEDSEQLEQDCRQDALSAALKTEQKVEDLLAKRQEQLDQIRILSANIDSEKLSHAKELLRKKQELMEKQEELQSFLKSKNMTISDLLAQKEHVNDHGAKMLLLKQLTEDSEQLKQDCRQ
ncbi:unnamed protein product [Strongylus vulgaris]|uniref:Uncharacterized protein n=1 Tax=Strongylus vulgaris TaxID=40348 RepID=A0A3P7JNW8_STRVU|nr:unnamed protein product [Strongylus vulgaris]